VIKEVEELSSLNEVQSENNEAKV